MSRLQILFVLVFVLGAVGITYVYGDPVSWYWCDTTNAAPSTRCVTGNMVSCANYTLAGYGYVPGGAVPKTAEVKSPGPPPTVGTCEGTWAWWYTCNNSYPCRTECKVCNLESDSVTALDKDECQ